MTRRKHCLQLDVTNFENIAVVEKTCLGISPRPLKLPIGTTLRREIRDGTMALHKLASATQVVGMDVSLCHCRDAKTIFCGDREVAIHIALGIDDHCLARALATDEIRILRKRMVRNLS